MTEIDDDTTATNTLIMEKEIWELILKLLLDPYITIDKR